MRKNNFKSLNLNKKFISNFNIIKGGVEIQTFEGPCLFPTATVPLQTCEGPCQNGTSCCDWGTSLYCPTTRTIASCNPF